MGTHPVLPWGAPVPVPQVGKPPPPLSVGFSSAEVTPSPLTASALLAASPRLGDALPELHNVPIRQETHLLEASSSYLISVSGLRLVKCILPGFKIAKELRARRSYGAGVV